MSACFTYEAGQNGRTIAVCYGPASRNTDKQLEQGFMALCA